MIKRYLAAAAITVMAVVFTGCTGQGSDIGQEKAKEIALQDAGVQEKDTSRMRVTKDRDDGRSVYEVEFDVKEKEYSYEVNAADGDIITAESEINENYLPRETTQTETTVTPDEQTQPTQIPESSNQPNRDQTSDKQPISNEVQISEAQAKSAALERVPGAGEQDLKMELEFDDGKYIYEGDIIYQQKEYEFEIDANTGAFLKWSEERY